MLHPSYSELIDVLNSENDTDNQITSRYTIVIAAAKRARQLVDGSPTAMGAPYNDKAVSTAVTELKTGKIKIMLSAQAQKENRDFDSGMENLNLRPDDKITSRTHILENLVTDEEEEDVEDYGDFDEDTDVELLDGIDIDDDELLDDELDKVSFEDELEKELFADTDDVFDDDDTYGE